MQEQASRLREGAAPPRPSGHAAPAGSGGISLRGLVQAIAEQAAVVAAALGRLYEAAFVMADAACGPYLGTVGDAIDPRQQGRVQVLIAESAAEPKWALVSRPVGVTRTPAS
ncbi:MAG: hypothetical protein ABR604_02180 [Jatrophihabitantaceae bacterium]